MGAWSSKKQATVALSSTEAEYAAVTSATQEVFHLRALLKSVGYEQSSPTMIHCDNQSTMALAKNPVLHARTRHVEVRMHFVRDTVEEKVIQLKYVRSDENMADVLTKALSSIKHLQHTTNLGLVAIVEIKPGGSGRS